MALAETSPSLNIPGLVPMRGILPMGRSDYWIPNTAMNQLTEYVVDLERKPRGQLVGTTNLSETIPSLQRKAVMESLPKGLTEGDFIQILQLAMLTECATDAYAAIFYESSRRFKMPWLHRFTSEIWVPDEYQHTDPFKKVLMHFGFSEQELNQQIAEVLEKTYEHTSGGTPVQLTIFGALQEYLTDGWYGMIAPILDKTSPEAAEDVRRVKRRETFHMVWYRDMTAIQVISNPRLIDQVAEALDLFTLPGNHLIPDLQRQAEGWIPKMGGDFNQIERRVIRLISSSLDDNPEYLGEAIINYGARRSESFISSLRALRLLSAVPLLGSTINTLAGQAAMDHEGINKKDLEDDPFYRITSPVRKIVVRKLGENFRLDSPEATGYKKAA